MYTLQDLAAHLEDRLRSVPLYPPPEADKLPADATGIAAAFWEKEIAHCRTLDFGIQHILATHTDVPLSSWETWFLSQRWHCAAGYLGRLARTEPPMRLASRRSLASYYPWLLIRLWYQERAFYLQNFALSFASDRTLAAFRSSS